MVKITWLLLAAIAWQMSRSCLSMRSLNSWVSSSRRGSRRTPPRENVNPSPSGYFRRVFSGLSRTESQMMRTQTQPNVPYTLPLPFRWKKIDKIKITGGDVIVCGRNQAIPTFKTHWLLAVNGYELVHVIKNGIYLYTGQITIDKRLDLPGKYDYIDCNNCKNLGNRGISGDDLAAVTERAFKWLFKYTFFDSDSCSSYHWVMYWVSGSPPTPRRSLLPGFSKRMHPYCRLNTILTDPEPREVPFDQINFALIGTMDAYNLGWGPNTRAS
ncbi:uncharacterized protein [Bemisia tabaci]|uniref:uncharacterized protein isoform X1 n=1 Tax=Bemisia tabaci TaxID=7038 RepID=UPI003B28406F